MRPEGILARLALAVAAVVSLLWCSALPVAAQEDPVPDTGEVTSTTLADLDTPSAPVREAPLTESEKASRTIQWVVGGLVGLAVLVLVATVVFWRRTRPSLLMAEEASLAANASPPTHTQPPTGAPAPAAVGATPVSAPTDPAAHSPSPTAAAPLPTGPGSWGAFAEATGLQDDRDAPAPGDGGAAPAPPTPAAEVPRPAFETAATDTWASQGWEGNRDPAEPARALPQGFRGSARGQPSWRWNERDDSAAVQATDEAAGDTAGEAAGEVAEDAGGDGGGNDGVDGQRPDPATGPDVASGPV